MHHSGPVQLRDAAKLIRAFLSGQEDRRQSNRTTRPKPLPSGMPSFAAAVAAPTLRIIVDPAPPPSGKYSLLLLLPVPVSTPPALPVTAEVEVGFMAVAAVVVVALVVVAKRGLEKLAPTKEDDELNLIALPRLATFPPPPPPPTPPAVLATKSVAIPPGPVLGLESLVLLV